MDKVKCLEILCSIYASGEYDEDVIEDVCDDLGITSAELFSINKELTICDNIGNDNLMDYIQWIRTGSEEVEIDWNYIKYVVKLMTYRYEFYKRSSDPDQLRLFEYRDATNEMSVVKSLDSNPYDEIEYFNFEYNPNLPLEYNLKRLEDFKMNMEVVIKNYHENEIDDSFIPKSLIHYGIRNYNKYKELGLFTQWDRYLRVYDLVKEKAEDARKPAFYDTVGKKIKEEFGVYKTYNATDLRANIKKDYAKACQLIESAVEGTFPVLKPKVTPMLDDI